MDSHEELTKQYMELVVGSSQLARSYSSFKKGPYTGIIARYARSVASRNRLNVNGGVGLECGRLGTM